jgi:hypothetical protein
MITVACVKWGTKYGPEFVNRLYYMVERNLTIPFRFCCYTEDATDLIPEVNVIPIESDDLEGYWNKVALFKLFTGKVLYIDLDTVIQNNIDKLITHSPVLCGVKTYWSEISTDGSEYYVTMKWKTPFNSSVMVWNAEDYYWVWDVFASDMDMYILKYFGDDKFLGNEVPNKTAFPKGWIYSRTRGLGNNEKPNYKMNDLLSAYHYPDAMICMLNGATKPIHYEGLEHYWDRSSIISSHISSSGTM